MLVERDLETSQQRTIPTAMGLRPLFLFKESSPTNVREDGEWCPPRGEKIYKQHHRSENLTGSIRGGAAQSLTDMAGSER